MRNKTSNPASNDFLRTLSATVTATAAIVGVHHYYRKQRQPEARLQDYAVGISAKMQSSAPLPRLQYAYQQAKLAYQNYPDNNCLKDSAQAAVIVSEAGAVAKRHTTTMLPRPVCWVSGVAAMPKGVSLANSKNTHNDNDFGVVGIDADLKLVWQTTMPERVHDIVVQPIIDGSTNTQSRDVVVMGRRPSEVFWVLDTATGQVKHTIKAATDRHFYGHACYSLDGAQLYITENDTVSLDGKIGIYNAANGYQKTGEFDSHGIGPHELIMHPDGETLIVANGGIKTEQASREELNLDSMQPSLVYLNRHTGKLLEQITPEHNQMSIRHLAIHNDGTVMIGVQFQGERHINVPLVLTHQRGDADFAPLFMPNNQWQRFHQYIASVAVDSQHNLLCVTTPIGGCAAIYDLTTCQLIDSVPLPDCAGASVSVGEQGGFIVSDGQGQITTLQTPDRASITTNSVTYKMSFDNHLQALL